MAIARHFLGWNQAALKAACLFLQSRYLREKSLDLSAVTVVVPGKRAGRRLLELLVDLSEEEDLLLTPPVITTEGHLPELLYIPQHPFATDLTQKLAFVKALQSLSPNRLKAIIPFPPASTESTRWLELGEMLRGLHLELAAEGLAFDDVARVGKTVSGFTDEVRWQALREVQQAYLRTLDSLELWDKQTARLVAIKQREFSLSGDLVLIGTVDINHAMRQILDQVAEKVTILIPAPESLADHFDEHGCLVTDKWRSHRLNFSDSQLVQVDSPADQAFAVGQWLAKQADRYSANDIIIGMLDERLVSQVQRELRQRQVNSRWVTGKLVGQTLPFRLIRTLTDYSGQHRFSELAALARHVDFETWALSELEKVPALLDNVLMGRYSLGAVLDDYYERHLTATIDPKRVAEQDAKWIVVSSLVQLLESTLLKSLTGTRSLRNWADTFLHLLAEVYKSRSLSKTSDQDHDLLATLTHFRDAWHEISLVPKELDPPVSLDTAISTLLMPLASDAIPSPAETDAVELLGWLELPLDDAPAVIVTSFNEGFVPQSVQGDKFLPNELRKELGLMHNDRRYARDAFSTQLLLATRPDVAFLMGKRDGEGSPMVPSRLVFAADDAQLTPRALRLFSPLQAAPVRRPPLAPPGEIRKQSHFEIPELPPLMSELEELSVSQFRSYLQCPYRFYLSHILKLDAPADDSSELSAGDFGDLVHEVLQQYGSPENSLRRSTNADKITAFLDDRLQSVFAHRYGTQVSRPAVRVQIAQVKARLARFAQWQAERNREGWEIAFCEQSSTRLVTKLEVDDRPVRIIGRIDRIDYHSATNTFDILDYKTSDRSSTPEKHHQDSDGEWVDLQLPLYRHLVKDVLLFSGDRVTGKPRLGFIHLPKDLSRVDLAIAQWTDADLERADEKARQVVRAIRNNQFSSENIEAPPYPDIYSAICQDRLLSSLFQATAEEGGEE
ncbi:MAG: PD-(D/E)XK nuclease family protein [Planctomycetaceae bacterium]